MLSTRSLRTESPYGGVQLVEFSNSWRFASRARLKSKACSLTQRAGTRRASDIACNPGAPRRPRSRQAPCCTRHSRLSTTSSSSDCVAPLNPCMQSGDRSGAAVQEQFLISESTIQPSYRHRSLNQDPVTRTGFPRYLRDFNIHYLRYLLPRSGLHCTSRRSSESGRVE